MKKPGERLQNSSGRKSSVYSDIPSFYALLEFCQGLITFAGFLMPFFWYIGALIADSGAINKVDITMNQVIPCVLPGRSQQPSYEEFTNAQAYLERIETIEEKRLKPSFLYRFDTQFQLVPYFSHTSRRVLQRNHRKCWKWEKSPGCC